MNDEQDFIIKRLKVRLGMGLVVLLVVLAVCIALGHVDEKSSYGLREVIQILSFLAGVFGGWAFGSSKE